MRAGMVGIVVLAGVMMSIAAEAEEVRSVRTSSKESYQQGFCNKFEAAQDTVDVENIFEDIDSSPYKSSLEEFWTTPACLVSLRTTAKGTILFNTASNTVKNENFPQVVHDFLIEEKNRPDIWLKAINSTTSDGYTFLDYLQYTIARDYYKGNGTRDAALRIISYLCKNGGMYSKYKETEKCP